MRLRENLRKFQLIGSAWLVFVGIQLASALGSADELTLHQVRIEKLSRSILAFDIANGSDLAAVALSDLHIRVWRLGSGQLVHEFSFDQPKTDRHLKLSDDVEPTFLRFSPDGMTLAVSFLNVIHLYSVKTWNEEKTLGLVGEARLRPDIRIAPERPELTTRSAEEANAEKSKPTPNINQTMRELSALRNQGDGRTRILTFEFSGDGSSILASYCRSACFYSTWGGFQWEFPSGSDPVRLWNVSSASLKWERLYDNKGMQSRLALLPDGQRFIALDSQPGRCAIGGYDLAAGQALWSHTFGACLHGQSIVILPDGKSFITNRIDEAKPENAKKHLYRYGAIYETNTGKKIVDLPEADGLSEADVSSDGSWLASITWKGTQFQIWDLQAKKIVMKAVPKGWSRTADCVLNRVRLSPDNRWLVVGCNVRGDLAVYQWDEGHSPKP